MYTYFSDDVLVNNEIKRGWRKVIVCGLHINVSENYNLETVVNRLKFSFDSKTSDKGNTKKE